MDLFYAGQKIQLVINAIVTEELARVSSAGWSSIVEHYNDTALTVVKIGLAMEEEISFVAEPIPLSQRKDLTRTYVWSNDAGIYEGQNEGGDGS